MTASDPQAADIQTFLASTQLFSAVAPEVLSLMVPEFTWVDMDADQVLFSQGDPGNSLYLIWSGRLSVTSEWMDTERVLAEPGPGHSVGEISLLGNSKRSATVRATEPTRLLSLSAESFANLLDQHPDQIGPVAEAMTERMQRIRFGIVLRASEIFKDVDQDVLHELESGMELLTLQSGSVLCRQGEPADSLFVVVSGRLRIWLNQPGSGSLFLNEVGPGESVGEMGVITGAPRAADVIAVRDSTVAKMNGAELERLLGLYPHVINRLFVGIIVRHFGGGGKRATSRGAKSANSFALIPVRQGVPVAEAGEWLAQALSEVGPTLLLTSQQCDQIMGREGFAQAAFDDPRNATLLDWLNEQEFNYRYVIYVADERVSNWSRRCLRQGDHILFMADAKGPPEKGEIEQQLTEEHKLTGRRTSLVLLHDTDTEVPSGSLAWLSARRIGNHHHVRLRRTEDFGRLARFLTGRAVAVVFGGGGARGFAHIGIIRALTEAGIPIDLVGGTSMGALIGAQCAMQWDGDTIIKRTLDLCLAGENLTIPMVSVFRGRKFTRGVRAIFGDATVEDLWRRYFSVSCNLSRATVMIHDKGLLSEAVLASNTPPALFPPKVHEDGDLLVDGALLNNVPADVMERYNEGGTLIAIDVNPKDDLLSNTPYDGGLSGWKVLMSRLNPFTERMNVPNIMDVIARSTAIGGLAQRKIVRDGIADLYLEPPVSEYPIMGYANAPKIADKAYVYAKPALARWQADSESSA